MLTEYKLLGGPYPVYCTNYRGLMRREPVYDSKHDESHPVNRAFFEYMDGFHLFIPTLADALRLHALFQEFGHRFELIQLDRLDYNPTDNVAGFLGYEVYSEKEGSYLATGIPPYSDNASPYAILWNLAREYFLPRLNKDGLFKSWDSADLFLKAIHALRQVDPYTPQDQKALSDLAVYRLSLVKPAIPDDRD